VGGELHPFDMTGRTVLVTGSTAGMGLAMAKGFFKCGARVVISSNDAEDVASTLSGAREAGMNMGGIVCDLYDLDSVASLATRASERFGTINTLVAHGGGWVTGGSVADTSAADFEKMLISGPVHALELIRHFLPLMAAAQGGSVVVTTSMASVEANTALGGYGAAKAALNSIVRNIAAEWGPRGIRANAIAPGIVRTAFSESIWGSEGAEETVAARIPLGRIAEPEDVVGAALLLGSPAGSYISGTTLLIDGGRHVI
jgi:NAD(P)-dependent dehydrogenase (short-subunit alcohol dehydrogenase family)